jgi:hypothetical protein
MSAPVIIDEWAKGSRGDLVRFALDEFKGKPTFDIRTWYTAEDETSRPTKAGVTFAVEQLPRIAAAVNRALIEARRRGLLAPETGSPPATDGEGRGP